MTTPSPQDPNAFVTAIPVEHMRPFLEFCLEEEPDDLDEDDRQIALLVREIINNLAKDPDSPLAWALINTMSLRNLADPAVSRMYSAWAARKLLGA